VDKVVDWVVLGRFGRVHGIKGFITLHSYTEPRENILGYLPWHALINKQWQPLKIIQTEVTTKHILVQVEGYTEREQVANLTNVEIGVPKEKLPNLEPGDYYWHQLMGMKVINQQGDELGTVVELLPTGANDVLVVEGKTRHLIPYLPGRYVIKVDTNEKEILVDWDTDF
jgi:16S rRNA processing protein RimM